ncbi:MAG: D-glycerate dehydrogenase [Ignavibacteriae bacterium]|nr:D-glycerate dehydrogenase [Ignavibacteriota bacterium]
MKPKIYITHKIPEKGINMLRNNFDVELNNFNGIVSKEQLIEKAKDKHVILSLLSDNIDFELINSCKHLKVISNYAVGYNNIDIMAATEKGILVTNTPRILDETTADFVFALILSVARRVVESDKFMRTGKFKGWGPMEFLGHDVFNSTLGVIGMGSIGKEVARRGYYGFSMNVLYYDKTTDPASLGFKVNSVSFDTLLRESDFISVNVPLTENTYHLIGEKVLKKMKKTAYLINTSRGPVIDEKALFKALKDKRIAGAAIDVYENEPDFTQGLEYLDNLIMTPHIASASKKTRELMSVKAAQNIIDYYEGRIPEGLVNRDVIKLEIS